MWWPFKKKDSDHELSMLLELYIKAGRRCAYDLDHASGEIRFPVMGEDFYAERAKYWLDVFNPCHDHKNYVNRFQIEIRHLESRIGTLERDLTKHGISVPVEF